MTVTALVLCGGGSRRFGADKTRQPLGDSTVLDRLLTGLPEDWDIVAVGEERPTTRPTTWAREDPAGGGPLAGIAAGMAHVTTEFVVTIAGDMPFAARPAHALTERLKTNPDLDAISAVTGDGRPNPLLTAYRSAAVRSSLPTDASGQPARRLLHAVHHETLRIADEDSLDVDTPEALEVARHRVWVMKRLEP